MCITFPAIFKVQDETIEQEIDGADDARVYAPGSVSPPGFRNESPDPVMSDESMIVQLSHSTNHSTHSQTTVI